MRRHLRGYYDRAICSVFVGQAGLSILQSFAFGVSVMTQRSAISGGQTENIIDGVNGFLTGSAWEDLSGALLDLLSDPEIVTRMVDNALHQYRSTATVSQMFEGFQIAIERDTKPAKGQPDV
jgi:glycosyltransferase involved in cell wall biosynthesis